jgi:hypothetical protein
MEQRECQVIIVIILVIPEFLLGLPILVIHSPIRAFGDAASEQFRRIRVVGW